MALRALRGASQLLRQASAARLTHLQQRAASSHSENTNTFIKEVCIVHCRSARLLCVALDSQLLSLSCDTSSSLIRLKLVYPNTALNSHDTGGRVVAPILRLQCNATYRSRTYHTRDTTPDAHKSPADCYRLLQSLNTPKSFRGSF